MTAWSNLLRDMREHRGYDPEYVRANPHLFNRAERRAAEHVLGETRPISRPGVPDSEVHHVQRLKDDDA